MRLNLGVKGVLGVIPHTPWEFVSFFYGAAGNDPYDPFDPYVARTAFAASMSIGSSTGGAVAGSWRPRHFALWNRIGFKS
jgi:hypothetical protein